MSDSSPIAVFSFLVSTSPTHIWAANRRLIRLSTQNYAYTNSHRIQASIVGLLQT